VLSVIQKIDVSDPEPTVISGATLTRHNIKMHLTVTGLDSWLKIVTSVGSCEHGSEPLDFINKMQELS
jgi:hypothetical protein